MVKSLVSLFKLTKEERKMIKAEKNSRIIFLENESNVYFHYLLSAFLREKRLIFIFFLIIVIFFNIKYIKTRPYSNKILSQNFKPISGIKLEIIG